MMVPQSDQVGPPHRVDDGLRPSWLSVAVQLAVLGVGIWLASMAVDRFGPVVKVIERGHADQSPSTSSMVGLVVSVLIAAFCIGHAIRYKTVYLPVVIGGMAFGLLVEFFDITFFHTYVYGTTYFMLMGKVPLMIVLAWGAIIHSAMKTSDYLQLRWYLKPIYDGMLALTIDLALDPVAVSVGLWRWEIPPSEPPSALFLGIPLANFYGWFMVVASYSLAVRAGLRLFAGRVRADWTAVVATTAAIPAAFVLFLASLAAYLVAVERGFPEALVFSLVLGALVLAILVYLMVADHDDEPNSVSLSTPLLLHAYVMFEYYFAHLYLRRADPGRPLAPDGLIIMLPMIAAFSMISFAWPFLDGLARMFSGVARAVQHRAGPGRGVESPPQPVGPAR